MAGTVSEKSLSYRSSTEPHACCYQQMTLPCGRDLVFSMNSEIRISLRGASLNVRMPVVA